MITTTKSGAGISRYLRLYRVLSQAVAEGRFAAGQPLPSEPRLMRDYGVSRSTVRRALAGLEAEGRITRKRGSGTFARRQSQQGAASRDCSMMLDGTGGTPEAATVRTIAFQRIPTPAFLPAGERGFGAAAVLIRRVRSIVRQPMALETAYLPEEIGAGLTRRQLSADGGPLLALLASLGHRSVSVEREFAALGADPLVAGSLELAVGAPVFNVRTLAHGLRHCIVAYVECLYRPDHYEARAAIEIDDPKRQRRAGQRA
ncbi:MAG TPA: GntR family transcriptional regulator [Steroidobacteraceae bacterium]|jgi:GntR family transcriptional regulator